MGVEIIWEPPTGVVKRHFGHVTGSEVMHGNQTAEADARFDRLRYVINDFTDCTSLDATPVDVEETAAFDRAASLTNRSIRIAIVAQHPDVIAASNAYAANALTVFETRVFGSMQEARSWLAHSEHPPLDARPLTPGP